MSTSSGVASRGGEPVLVVGLGGSAGALDSLKAFFSSMPADSGAAFVIIQHLSPTHESLLPEILAKHTAMKVVQARDGVAVEPDCVYVIPPNHYLAIRDGVLSFTEPFKQEGLKLPIDYFLRSLAADRGERAVGILLSGSGADGTLGARAIRGAGGMVMAQDPQMAQFPDLPQSAVATGLVDYVLAPDQMPEALLNYLRQPYTHGAGPAAPLDKAAAAYGNGDVQGILGYLLAQTGCDFRPYKKGTVVRRIQRRMGLRYLPDLSQYLELLREDPQEVRQLLKDLLINVTAFFRDASAFEELRSKVLAPLVRAKQMDQPLRVWVPGCATGEEVYSLAMLLLEQLARDGKHCPLQMFATDIDEEALEIARRGLYPQSIAVDVGPERLSKFFVPQDNGYQVSEAVRKFVTFAAQNVLADPPFSRMDLISCRNLLIYVGPEAQAKLMARLNFALNPGGYLFLGRSETIGNQEDLFKTVSKSARLYRRLPPARPLVLDSSIVPGRKRPPLAGGSAAGKAAPPVYGDILHEAILNQFSASAVLVDRKGRFLQFHGQTGRYLDLPTSGANFNLLDLAREGLATRLRLAMQQAIKGGETVVVDRVPIERERDSSLARITVTPMFRQGEAEPLLAVFFEDVARPAPAGAQLIQSAGNETAIKELEDELSATQQDLQSTIGELQAANEELQSTNEELQSANEELETSTEELQSTNEELTSVNSQLQEKIEQLDAVNNDIANLLQSTQIATIFLDRELRIKMFTPPATKVFSLIAADIGRPINHLSMRFIGYDLTGDARAVAQGESLIQKEVKHADGSDYLMRIMPYYTSVGRAEGVVITFADVTRLQSMQRLASIVESSSDAIFSKALDGTLLSWNPAAEEIYGYSAQEMIGRNVSLLAPPELAHEIRDILERIKGGERIALLETERVRKDGHRIQVSLSVSPMMDASGQIIAASTVARDITERKEMELALKENEQRFRTMANSIPQLAWMANADGFITWYNDKWYQYTGTTPEQMEGWGWQSVHDPEVLPSVMKQWQGSIATGEPFDMTFPLRGADGRFRLFLTRVQPLKDHHGRVVQWFGTNTDVDELKRAEEELRESEARLRLAQESAMVGIWDWMVETGALDFTPELVKLYGLPPGSINTYRDWRDRVHPDDIAVIESRRDEAIARHEPFDLEFRALHASGQYRWIATKGGALYDDTGKAIRIFGVNIDITERKRAEEALRQSRERLAWVLEVTGVGLWLNELPLGRLNWDDRTRELFFVPPGVDPTIDLFWQRLHPDDREPTRLAVEAALRDRTSYAIDHRAIDPATGEVRWIRSAGQAAYAADGTPTRFDGINYDISERKRAEEALRNSEQLYRAIGESIDYGVWVCEPDGRNIYASESFLKLVGLTQQQCSDFGWGDILHPDDAEHTIAAWKECVRTGGTWDIEHRCKGVDGQWHAILARGVPVRDEKGEITCWAGINLDISRIKEAEQALRDADRHKDEFLAMLAHELRNPLAPVRNAVTVLQYAGSTDPRLQRQSGIISRQVTHMARLLDDLLDVSRITRGKIVLQKQPVHLTDVLAHAVETATPLVQSRNQTLHVTDPPDKLLVEGDPDRLAQVVGNLLNNALKYTHEGGEIWLEAKREGGQAVICVRDNGMGIAPEMLPRIFELFAQADRTLGHAQGGLGIGLTMVHRLVQMHGGTVDAHSAGLGYGSEFIVRLPALPEPGELPAHPTEPALKNQNRDRQTRRILVVDDVVDAADTLAEVLELWGHEVHKVHDGEAAVEAVRQLHPEVVLLDIGMPGMDGFEVARVLRREHPNQPMLLVALTGYAQDSDRQEALRAGFDAHLSKPVDLDTLRTVLLQTPSRGQ